MLVETADSYNQLNRILNIDRELDRTKDLDLLLEELLHIACREAAADAGTVYVVEDGQLTFRHTQNDTLSASLNPGEKLIYSRFKVPINDKSIAGFVARHGSVLNIPDMYNIDKKAPYNFDPSFDRKSGYRTVSSFTFPLVSSEGALLGVMQLINAKDRLGQFTAFNDRDKPFFEFFARFGSKAIQRAQMTRNLLLTITRFAGLRDPKETGAHVNRVAAYAVEIYERWARHRGVDKETIKENKDMLRMAAMLHDVGKVAISDVILKKPGMLSEHEYRIMKSHTWVGARQFSEQNNLNKIASEVAMHHHENWDGSGYPGNIVNVGQGERILSGEEGFPGGLREREIPLYARIVSLADVFDALSSNRIYKEAWSEDLVIETIKNESGKKFDPELVDIFTGLVPKLRSIREYYPD